MLTMLPRNIRESRAVRSSPCGGRSVARSATVAGGKLDVASPAVGRRAGGDRIHADSVAIRVTTAGYAAGIRGICPGSRYMDRTRIRENMRCSACDIDDTIDVLRG